MPDDVRLTDLLTPAKFARIERAFRKHFQFAHDIGFPPSILPPNPFYLDDGQQQVFLQVPDGKYTITETNPALIPGGGWSLTSIVCEDENGITWEVKQQATTTVEISTTRQIVECVFTNERPPVVGGYVMPVNKLELLVPWLGLIVLTGLAASGVVLVRKLKV